MLYAFLRNCKQFFQFAGNMICGAHYLNADVVAGAWAGCIAVQKVTHLRYLPPTVPLALCTAVWVIYNTDRLLDVRQLPAQQLASGRHRFYKQHYTFFTWLTALVAVATAIWILPLLDQAVMGFGLGLAALVGVYLLLVSTLGEGGRSWFSKETLVACLYTAGVWGSVYAVQGRFSGHNWLLMGIFALLALQNLLTLAAYETRADALLRQRSWARNLGTERIRHWLAILFSCILVLALAAVATAQDAEGRSFAVAEGIMAIGLYAVGRWPTIFGAWGVYRPVADGLFLLPWLMI